MPKVSVEFFPDITDTTVSAAGNALRRVAHAFRIKISQRYVTAIYDQKSLGKRVRWIQAEILFEM